MPAYRVGQKFFHNALAPFHKYRQNALLDATVALINGASQTLTSIGRYLPGAAQVKNKIKRVDRLLGNVSLHRDIPLIFKNIISMLTNRFSLCVDDFKPREIMKLYSRRMQIEQNFRDEKSERFGCGLRASYSHSVGCLWVLSLLATLSTIVLWLIGYHAENKGLHLRYQVNSIKSRQVISYLTPPPVMFFTFLYKDKKQEMPRQITQSSASGNAIYCRY